MSCHMVTLGNTIVIVVTVVIVRVISVDVIIVIVKIAETCPHRPTASQRIQAV